MTSYTHSEGTEFKMSSTIDVTIPQLSVHVLAWNLELKKIAQHGDPEWQ